MEFLTRVYGRLPMWAWIGIGVTAVLIYRSVTNKNAIGVSSSNQVPSASNGNAATPNIFFLPQGSNSPSGTSLTVNVNRPVGYRPTTMPGIVFTPPPADTQAPSEPTSIVTVQKWPGTSSGGLAEWDTTLWGIANHFGTTVADLQTLNSISNPNLIYPGEQIKVS